MSCSYQIDGKTYDLPAFKAYLADGGLDKLYPDGRYPWMQDVHKNEAFTNNEQAEKVNADEQAANTPLFHKANEDKKAKLNADIQKLKEYNFKYAVGDSVIDHETNKKYIVADRYIENGEARYTVYPPGKKQSKGYHVWIREADLRSARIKSSFAGESAATADKYALSTAKKRLAKGDDVETVRQETGWHQEKDGKWRFEISDKSAELTNDAIDAWLSAGQEPVLMLSSVIDHPALFAAYPQLRNISVKFANLPKGEKGSYGNGIITINKDIADPLSTLLHEIQHGIQSIEGFATGGNLKTFDRNEYTRQLGEVEARNVQKRQNMTALERRLTSPSNTQDINPNDVIVSFNGKVMQNAPLPENSTKATKERNTYATADDLRQAITATLDKEFGNKFTDALFNTGMVKIISRSQIKEILGDQAKFHAAWHGSPWDHDKFDSSKIGTGEGAQAYGYGLYFTDKKEIAEWYRDKLSGQSVPKEISDFAESVVKLYDDYKSLSDYENDANESADNFIDFGSDYGENDENLDESYNYINLSDSEKALIKALENDEWDMNLPHSRQEVFITIQSILNNSSGYSKDVISAFESFKKEHGIKSGKLYQVELAPTTDEYLDWDKPLSEQSELVKSALKKIGYEVDDDYTGENFYRDLTSDNKQRLAESGDFSSSAAKLASDDLHKLGVRGIRYKAEGGKSDAYNYVIFNDEDVSITAKYSKERGIKAFYNPEDKTTYLVHDNITKETNLNGLLTHEIAVHALQLGKNDKEFQSILQTADRMRNAGHKAMQDAYAMVPKDTPEDLKLEEMLGYYLENNSQSTLAKRFIAWFRSQLRKLAAQFPAIHRGKFAKWVDTLSADDLIYIARETLRTAPQMLDSTKSGGDTMQIMKSEQDQNSKLSDIENAWDDMGIDNFLSEKGDFITVSKIIVPKDKRNSGIGTKAMKMLFDYADRTGKSIVLTPSSDFGGSKTRLNKWYKLLGFRKYKGYYVREELIREPIRNNPDIRYSIAQEDEESSRLKQIADSFKNDTRPMPERAKSVMKSLAEQMDRLSPLGTLPNKADYLEKRYLTQGRIAEVDVVARKLYEQFKNAGEDAPNIYAYLTDKDASPNIIKDEEIRKRAEETKKTLIGVGERLVKRGLLDEQTFQANKGAYLPRLYLRHLLKDQDIVALGTGKKPSDLGYLKKRKDIPEDVRRLILGEITEPGYLASKGYGVQMRDVALMDWLEQISQNDEWILPDSVVDWKGQRVTPFYLKAEAQKIRKQSIHYTETDRAEAVKIANEMDSVADKALEGYSDTPDGWKQMPDSPRFGNMRGLIVRKEIYDDIVGATQINTGDMSVAEKILGNGGTATKATQWWKWAKVAANPPSQIRNFISNGVLLHLSGVDFHQVPSRVIEAIKEVRNNGKYFQVAKKYGVTESTFAVKELPRIDRELLDLKAKSGGRYSWDHAKNLFGKLVDKTSDAYQWSEAVFKTAKIIDEMKKGRSETEAALEAQKWLFDYSLVNPSIRYLRNAPIGSPFLTFATKALPRLVEVAATHPMRFAPYMAIPFALTAIIAGMNDVDDDDVEKLYKALPEWLQKRGHAYLLPYKDDNGRWQAMDFGYFFPWTQWTELGGSLLKGDVGEAFSTSGLLGGPLVDLVSAAKTGIDPFTQKKIVDERDPPARQVASLMWYLYRMAAPTWLTDIGAAGHLWRALDGTVDKYGEPKTTIPQAALRFFGANLYPIDPVKTRAENIRKMRFEISDIKRRRTTQLRDRNLTAEELADIQKEYGDLIKERMQQLREYAKDSAVNPKLR